MSIAGTGDLKEVVVADLKAYAALVAVLPDATQIKEAFYQGTAFDLPGVRVQVESLRPINDREQCNHMRAFLAIRSYSEKPSSDEASDVALLIMKRLHRRYLKKTGAAPNFYIWLRSTGMIGPTLVRQNLWMAETDFSGTLYDSAAWVGADAA